MEIHSFIYCYASRNPYYPEADFDSQLDTNVQACHDFRRAPAIVRITGSYFFFFFVPSPELKRSMCNKFGTTSRGVHQQGQGGLWHVQAWPG